MSERMHQHLIIGLRGQSLTGEERRWLAQRPPRGVILFARNIDSPEQVRALLAEVRDCTGRECWAVIDEEGGRVSRLPWPPFSDRRSAGEYGRVFAADPDAAIQQVYADNLAVGRALEELGFTHNCAPVLDLFCPQGDRVIGDRAYGSDAATVSALAQACMRGLSDAGVAAVGKHFPGHGRASADSHKRMAEVDVPLDLLLIEAEPFARLVAGGMRHVMTAHVIYPQAASEIATLSPFWLQQILRRKLAFNGHIWSDDLCMRGVGMEVPDAAVAALQAGCDTLLVCEPEGVAAMYRPWIAGA